MNSLPADVLPIVKNYVGQTPLLVRKLFYYDELRFLTYGNYYDIQLLDDFYTNNPDEVVNRELFYRSLEDVREGLEKSRGFLDAAYNRLVNNDIVPSGKWSEEERDDYVKTKSHYRDYYNQPEVRQLFVWYLRDNWAWWLKQFYEWSEHYMEEMSDLDEAIKVETHTRRALNM